MLASCLNPSCNASFRYLYDGRIFTFARVVTTPNGVNAERVIEHYWLCASCGRSMTVVVENGVAKTVPIQTKFIPISGPREARLLRAG